MEKKINQYVIGYDKYLNSGDSVGVREVLRVEDLQYSIYINDTLEKIRKLSKEEAIAKFGNNMNKDTIEEVLNRQ